MLKTRRSQAGEAVLIDRPLPGGEFIGREHIAVAGVFKRKHTVANSGDDLGLAMDHPSLRRSRRQIRRLRTKSIWVDYGFAIPMMRHSATTPIFILAPSRTARANNDFLEQTYTAWAPLRHPLQPPFVNYAGSKV
jgi:hypothetical protein